MNFRTLVTRTLYAAEADFAALLERKLVAAFTEDVPASKNARPTRRASRRSLRGPSLSSAELLVAARIEDRERDRAELVLRRLLQSGAIATERSNHTSKYRVSPPGGGTKGVLLSEPRAAPKVAARTVSRRRTCAADESVAPDGSAVCGANTPPVAIPREVALSAPVAAVAHDDYPPRDALDLPILRVASRSGEVVIVGGLTEPDALDELRRSTGIPLEWVALPHDGAPEIVLRLATLVRAGDVVALIVLDDLVDGRMVLPLAQAARDRRLAVALACTGEAGALRRALIELDLRVAGEPRVAL